MDMTNMTFDAAKPSTTDRKQSCCEGTCTAPSGSLVDQVNKMLGDPSKPWSAEFAAALRLVASKLDEHDRTIKNYLGRLG